MDDKAVRDNIAQMLREGRLARAGGATKMADLIDQTTEQTELYANIPDAHENNADFFRCLDLIWRVVRCFMRTRGG
jgi:hypothetical protein